MAFPFLMQKLFSLYCIVTAAAVVQNGNGNTEIHLPKKPTTTPTPYVFTTVKPPKRQNKQQYSHQHKAQHENKGTKDLIGGPNQIQAIRETEVILANEGK
jgi:hypothetical protein